MVCLLLFGVLILTMVLTQVIDYYKDKVVHIVADKPQEDVADQIRKAVA